MKIRVAGSAHGSWLAKTAAPCDRFGMERLAQYIRKMRQVLYKRGRKREEIEDLMQDAVVRLLEYCQRGGEVRQPEAFLVSTVVRLSMNRDRNEHGDLYACGGIETLRLEDPGPAPDQVFAAEETLDKVRRTLDLVSRRTRQIFFMHRLEGLSYAQIAHQTGLAVSTVEKHIARAMTILLEEKRRERQRV